MLGAVRRFPPADTWRRADLEAAQGDHAALLAAADAALDDLEKAAELAEAQARVGHLVDTHRDMLTAARERTRATGFAALPFIAEDYRKVEAAARDWIASYDAKTDELLNALCEHTENDVWRGGALGVQGRARGRTPSPAKRERMIDAWQAGRAARFIEIVTEGSEGELLARA